ncbi:hypothetical protein Lal_00041167 [Lupinus albus]|uniref:Uncharacterized protein n=1 Tax=Lupinus albus TaxID=3870 RepID=A0A6A5NZP0_LUPAL|nr:hypothetical protein Lalb_Chr18g0060201 [Lupinus albus]KAF1890441.1 hypothetical protein Lal_00041167 [Lupinus albus]
MAETVPLSMPMIEEEEIIDDDFYEKIQAPKFVDLTAPDPRRSGDDRHWFCFRVGCDQQHEQELDSEAIYKNFVLRVMAARSPNLRLRKALKSRETSANLKCPNTAPPKPRVSRMALISSFSHKINNNNAKVKHLSKKVPASSATPNAKVRQSPAVAKALTAPRNQKISNLEQFRTVQSKKAMNVVVPKSRVVAKALVFHSPKKVKVVKAMSSIELNTPMKALCSAMKKLELYGAKKNEEGCSNTMPVASTRKQFRGREVKSRVFDSLYSNNRKAPEANTVKCLKENKVKSMLKRQVTMPHEEAENCDSSNMEIDDKSRGGSLERWHESVSSGGDITSLSRSNEEETKTNEGCENEERRNPISEEGKIPEVTQRKGEKYSMASGDKENEGELTENDNMTSEGSENQERRNPLSEKGRISEVTNRKGEENSRAFDNKENEGAHNENDDKESASAPDENIVMITNYDDPKKAFFGSKHEGLRKTPKKSTSTLAGSQIVKYRKLKPTNPKPFKLRTDERGIHKEANLVKKDPLPLKETTDKAGKLIRKHQNIRRASELDTDNYSSSEEKSNQTTQGNPSGSIQSDNSNGKRHHRLYAKTPHRNPGVKLQKPNDMDNPLEHGEKAAKRLNDNFNRKSQMMQHKVLRSRGALSRKKEKVLPATPCKLSVIAEKPSNSNILKPKEVEKPCDNDVSSPASKVVDSVSRPCSQRKRALTVPREPKFHSLHVPKSCITMKQT